MRIFRLLIIIFGLLFFVFNSAQAVNLYFDPSNAKLNLGEEFKLKVKIDTEKECINTIKAEIEYDKNLLIAKDFLTGNSIIPLWLEEPEIKDGRISFSGGIPGGYCGEIPGEPGESNILGEIIFRVSQFSVSGEDTVEIKFLENSKVFLNNGLGTEAKLRLGKAQFRILKEKIPGKILKKELKEDKTPPESFGISVLKDPQVFEGKYFIVFNTQDKQTGVDHYEVAEILPVTKFLKVRHEATPQWKVAKSPYLLEDQSLRSIIRVKAVDKAGNERIIEFKPHLPAKPPFIYWKIVIPLILMSIWIIWWIIKRHSIKSRQYETNKY